MGILFQGLTGWDCVRCLHWVLISWHDNRIPGRWDAVNVFFWEHLCFSSLHDTTAAWLKEKLTSTVISDSSILQAKGGCAWILCKQASKSSVKMRTISIVLEVCCGCEKDLERYVVSQRKGYFTWKLSCHASLGTFWAKRECIPSNIIP